MKEISLWSVDDVDDDTRELALNAAQNAGLTLGAWIDRAIRTSTGLNLDDQVERSDVVQAANLDPNASLLAPGNHGAPDNLFDVSKQYPADLPTNMGLQVDPQERSGVSVEPVSTPGSRGWPILPGLLGSGVPCIVLAAAIVFVGAGFLIYDVGFTGSEEQGQSATTIEGVAASANRKSVPLVPENIYRSDSLAPSEPGVIEMLTAAAEQGDAIAQHDLATRYLHGNTVTRDLDLAMKWLERAALQGHPASQHALDQLKDAGRGVEQNVASVVALLQQAAKAGNAEAQFHLAERFEAGRGVQRDAGRAAELYASAAAKGYSAVVTEKEILTSAAKPNSVVTEKATAPVEPALAPAVPALHAGKLLDKAGIAEAQQLLARLGFKPGPADGILGRRTIRGIKLYQSSAGLPNDGKATSSLLRELRKLAHGVSTKMRPAR